MSGYDKWYQFLISGVGFEDQWCQVLISGVSS